MAKESKTRRTYADLLGADPVPQLSDGVCEFCKATFKDSARVDAPSIHGGVRRYRLHDKGLACDPCIQKHGDHPLPTMRKHLDLELSWSADAKSSG